MQRIYASSSASISDLKKNPSGIISQAHGEPVAILNHNRPTAYLLPAETFELIMEQLDDLELMRLVRDRQSEATVKVKLDEL
ncbi:type II toxin-antitoxin system Phd/YefM family antitoxin [Trichlorobacter ammonificans]|uniref:Antitoxin n=1 Tax=Trichlorobacter ammonificans TaxID=2916410 RepID=A0ABM9DA37_9BACT|nr:type II toxin-antitoxin system prevent-host-death family antitoxin [Trichlorobacter ammonificans]CAH2032091.1 StbD replicon stabilization protein (antitoxin to StbE) [Trichlorobacter ammonificans]